MSEEKTVNDRPAPGMAWCTPCVDNRNFLDELTRVHLQWFAAEDEGRTEDPTEHKIRKAREDGKVAKSQDVTASVVLLFSVVTLGLLSRYMFHNMIEMTTYFLRLTGEFDVTRDFGIFAAFYAYFIRLVLPVAAVAFVAAALGNILQVGFLFSVKPITPDFEKITPNFGRFLKKAIFSAEAGFNLGKSVGKVIVLAFLGFLNIQLNIDRIARLVYAPFLESVAVIASLTFNVLLQAAILMLVLSVFDFFFQKKQHLESLKMTKQEIKEERKQYEGDPLIKSRLKQRMQEILSRNMIQNVPNADVVITNPTHFAVALEYKAEKMHAPTVTAKGQDNMAQKIREIARENSVPIVENKPLARALYADVEIGDSIPEKYYEAVVVVLKQVYTMSGRPKRAG